jgi:hypothetical protein
MTWAKFLGVTLIMLALAAPAWGKTYKSTYTISCSELWPAVKDALSNPDNNYQVTENDDAQMAASFEVKHAAHVTITGTILQRTNKVKLVPLGTACELQNVSNFSGWEHNDRGDFKKRVDESVLKLKSPAPAEPAKPAAPQ